MSDSVPSSQPADNHAEWSGALGVGAPAATSNTSVVLCAQWPSMLTDIPDAGWAAARRRFSNTRVQSALCTTRSGLQSPMVPKGLIVSKQVVLSSR